MKSKTLNSLEKNMREYIYASGLGMHSLNKTQEYDFGFWFHG